MDSSDYLDFGVGLAFGSILTRNVANSFGSAIDARTTLNVLTIPQTPAEIQLLLDQLDVRLAYGDITEATYQSLTNKWQARLDSLQPNTP